MQTDALVLGGGMAGLAAAYETASRGYETAIVDEAQNLGGQLLSQTQWIHDMPLPLKGFRGIELAAALKKRLRGLPVKYLLSHEIVGVFADGSIGMSNGQAIRSIAAGAIVAATGAAEKALPFPGWTLPGIMTIGAAQILINRERVYPGHTGIVIGSSDMALEIAQQLQAVGINVLGIVEEAAEIAARDQRIVDEFAQTGIPAFLGTEVVAANGRGKVQEIELKAADGSTEKHAVDFVCLDGGREPLPEVLSLLNCRFTYNEALGGRVPSYDCDFQTSVSGVFAAGQAAGITCHAGIFLTGALAGIGAAEFLAGGANGKYKAEKDFYRNELEIMEAAKLPSVWLARLAHGKMAAVSGKK